MAKRGRWARVGLAVVGVPQIRGISPARLLELLRGMSEEDQATFKRNMGPHGWAFSAAGGAGRSETESEGSLHDLPNSLLAVGAANAMGDVDIAGACGEHDLDGHVAEFENFAAGGLC